MTAEDIVDLKRDYVAASCNRYVHVMDWGIRYIAYASCHAVVLFNVEVSFCVSNVDSFLCDIFLDIKSRACSNPPQRMCEIRSLDSCG